MRIPTLLILVYCLIDSIASPGQTQAQTISSKWTEDNCKADFQGSAIHLTNTSGKAAILWMTSAGFRTGTIELDIKGKDVRGESFVGVAFHGKDNTRYDAVYFRPFNFRDPERKDRAVQYISLPSFEWDLLREKHPGKYEHSIVPDTDPNEWFHVKIVVNYPSVKVFMNGSSQPALEIEQLSDGKYNRLGLWIDSADGWFRNVSVTNALVEEQKLIVSALSGDVKIDNKVELRRRWTNKEKMIARNFLKRAFAGIGLETQEHPYEVTLSHVKPSRNPLKGTNLFVNIPASIKSSEYVILGAHYDTVEESPGAMDNATGCALIYSIAKQVLQIPNRKKNVIVVFFDQEEVGHAGSYAFANYLKEAGFDVHSVHTFDMIGWDRDGDRNIELELPTAELEALYRKNADVFNIMAYKTETSETDHREFRNSGFNAIGIGGEYKNGDTSPHHHRPTDRMETVDFEYLAFVTTLVYAVIEELMR
jgi:Peptidase family M28